MEEKFGEIARFMAKVTFGDDAVGEKRNDVVWYAYRVVIGNGLAVLGLYEDGCQDVKVVDSIIQWSLNMVAAVAPVGGSGPRHRVSLSLMTRIIFSISPSIIPLMRMIGSLGVTEAYKLFRPDSSFFAPLFGFDPAGGRTVRGGIVSAPEAFVTAVEYFAFLHSLWRKKAAPSHPRNIFTALQDGVERKHISVAEGLAIVAQLLIGMTAANGLVSCIKRLLHTSDNPLLTYGRIPETDPLVSQMNTPITEEELRQIFESDKAMKHFMMEVLRVDAPLQRLPRRVTKDTLLDQQYPLKAGDQLVLFIGAANLSDSLGGMKIRTYAEAKGTLSSPMLTFGLGIHRCIGKTLTLMDITAGVDAFFHFFGGNSENGEKERDLSDAVIATRHRITLELGEYLYNIDVGNYGHTQAKVIPLRK